MSTTAVWVFPGQGSQAKGMGAGLFERYPRLVEEAEAILGYSLRRLCLEDPERQLTLTQFTQPALFTVSALTYLRKREEEGDAAARCFAGHSLGEFDALFAAGAFDFATGLRLVQKRGQLMSEAPKGAMAAVLGLNEEKVRALLANSEFQNIDVANVNAADQIAISGLYDEIERCDKLFTGAGVRYIPLKVSAAFHSRFMRDVEREFAAFAAGMTFKPLEAEVIANCTARPYPKTDYQPLLFRQITSPVRWYESMSWLLARGDVAVTEVGPGDVLTKLQVRIKQSPMAIRDDGKPAPAAPVMAKPAKPRTIFMYSGQGSQYYGMGRELYQNHGVFRQAMETCGALCKSLSGRDMLGELYDPARRHDDLVDIQLSLPALFSLSYSLTQVLLDGQIRPDAVLGYSLGEYVAAVVAGILSLEDAMSLVCHQARWVRERVPSGGMLTVLAPVEHHARQPELYAGTTLACVNFATNFVVAGTRDTLATLKRRLDQQGVVSMLLPVAYAFHSAALDPIAPEVRKLVGGVALRAPQLPVYSVARGGLLKQADADYFIDVARRLADFRRAAAAAIEDGGGRFVDLGPSGMLATFIKHDHGGRVANLVAINQFGKNLQSISKLFADLRSAS